MPGREDFERFHFFVAARTNRPRREDTKLNWCEVRIELELAIQADRKTEDEAIDRFGVGIQNSVRPVRMEFSGEK